MACLASKKYDLKKTVKGGGYTEIEIPDHFDTSNKLSINMWFAGALGKDGDVYFMPNAAYRILK